MKAVLAGPETSDALGLVSPGLGLGASGRKLNSGGSGGWHSLQRSAPVKSPTPSCSRDSAAGSMPVDPDLENWQIRVLVAAKSSC